jgi:hypothetical protein
LTLTTFSQVVPAAARTFPKFLMHCSVCSAIPPSMSLPSFVNGTWANPIRVHIAFYSTQEHHLAGTEDETGYFDCMREDARELGVFWCVDLLDGGHILRSYLHSSGREQTRRMEVANHENSETYNGVFGPMAKTKQFNFGNHGYFILQSAVNVRGHAPSREYCFLKLRPKLMRNLWSTPTRPNE